MRQSIYSLTTLALLSTTVPVYAQSSYHQNDQNYPAQQTQDGDWQWSTQQQSQSSKKTYTQTSDTSGRGGYDNFTGPYVGGDVGYSFGNFDVGDPAGPDGDVGLDGWNGGLFAGYGMEHDFDWLHGAYAGFELGHEWSASDGSLGANSFDKNRAWLLTFRPGATYGDALGYGIIGYSRAEFEGNGADDDLDGLVLGAGATFDTGTAVKTRLEYTYTTYEDSDLAGVGFDGQDSNIKVGAVFQY